MNHFFLFVILLFALTLILPRIFRLFRGSPRDKARVVVEYAQRGGYALVNPSLAQALDSFRLEMLRNPAPRNSINPSSDIADIDELDSRTHLINRIRVRLVGSPPDSFRYLVIRPERHCLSAASSVKH